MTSSERKHGRQKVEYLLPELAPILEETYGVILYQEQVMKIAGVLASYSMAEADGLRKAMGKKIAEIMAQHRERFIKGAVENQYPEDRITKIFDLMEKFGGYGFNKSHSAAYALIAYQTAYLKAHFPVEFMAALLTSEMGAIDSVVKFIVECRSHGIPVLQPDINTSGKGFYGGRRQDPVRAGGRQERRGRRHRCDHRRPGRMRAHSLLFLNSVNGVDLKRVNKRVVESLIQCGAFDATGAHRAQMMDALEEALDYGQRVQKEKASPQMGLFDALEVERQTFNAPALPDIPVWDGKHQLTLEKESLGFYITGHPLDQFEKTPRKICHRRRPVSQG